MENKILEKALKFEKYNKQRKDFLLIKKYASDIPKIKRSLYIEIPEKNWVMFDMAFTDLAERYGIDIVKIT